MTSEFLQIFLEEAHDLLIDWEKHCISMCKNPSPEVCDALFRAAHNLKGSARSVGLDAYARLIHRGEDLITLVRSGLLTYSEPINQALLETQSILMLWREHLLTNSAYVPSTELAAIEAKLQALTQASLPAAPEADSPSPEGAIFFASESPPVAAKAAPSKREKATAEASIGTIRVASTKIDALMQLMGELSTHQAAIAHCIQSGKIEGLICRNAVHMASKITRELQMKTMGLRLVDLSRVFQRLERTAQELASAQQKKLRVELEGSDVELDKAVTEQVLDALVHMVRNAVDHGIERPEQRQGKPECACLRIRASTKAAGVAIEISDDGRGIDPIRVRSKAIELRLLQEGSELPPEKLFDFLFYPGFSTAREITEISGRGVGLDVVRQTIDRLGGTIQLTSQPGQGTSFHITLPVNVSIVDALVILVDQEHYVVPIQEISEVIDVKAHPIEARHADSITIGLRKKPLTIKHLSSYLNARRGRHADRSASEATTAPAMIIETRGHRVGFQFDKVVGHQSIVIRKLSPYMENLPGFSGSTILGDGEPAVIISPKVFAEHYFELKELRA